MKIVILTAKCGLGTYIPAVYTYKYMRSHSVDTEMLVWEDFYVQNLDFHNTGKPASWLSNKVFIVRTATGKHAKIKVISHQEPVQTAKGNTPTPGMLRFEYVYPID